MDTVYNMVDKLMSQPLTAAVEAYNDLFKYYGGGVVTSEQCGTEVNHAMTIVGYEPPVSSYSKVEKVDYSCRSQSYIDKRFYDNGCRMRNEIAKDGKCCKEIKRISYERVEEPAHWILMN